MRLTPATAVGVSSGVTTRSWPSDHRVSVVRATITTASGSRRRTVRIGVPGGVMATAAAWPAQAPTMWPPTTAASWSVHTRPGGIKSADGSKNRVPKMSHPRWNGSDTATTISWPLISRYVR